jgi:hypothetical protein
MGGGDWMELTQDRDRWWALVSTVNNNNNIYLLQLGCHPVAVVI